MPMMKAVPAANPDAYVASLRGWQRPLVELLRDAARSAPALEEAVKWGHLVYLSDGPVLLIRAEDERVLFGFWQGQRLTSVEPRLKAGGKYEMATLDLREGMSITKTAARRLVREAVALNQSLGDPTRAVRTVARTRRRMAASR
jgi:hypothetical protein